MEDLLGMVTELQEELEKLKGIWDAQREIHVDRWCQALASIKQEQVPETPQQEGNAVSIPQLTQGRSCKHVKNGKKSRLDMAGEIHLHPSYPTR